MSDERPEIAELKRRLGVRTDAQLLDVLQLERGLISDLCESVSEIADRDLIRALAEV